MVTSREELQAMSMKAPVGMPSVSLVLFYDDLGAAAEWLCKAFEFSERTSDRVTDESGVVHHAELELGNGLVILSRAYMAVVIRLAIIGYSLSGFSSVYPLTDRPTPTPLWGSTYPDRFGIAFHLMHYSHSLSQNRRP